ncbi:MAG: VOC family protein [Deltaproteobacteria bacterium]|nr:VOC family protein [Deltaproteobacteria bacterium]
MANPFVHFELMTGDVDKAKAFYGALFGWKLGYFPGMNYMTVKVGKGTCGGVRSCLGPEVSPQWLPHVHVEDIADTLAKARALGATVMKEATEVPGMGRCGILVDPGGAILALWQSKT